MPPPPQSDKVRIGARSLRVKETSLKLAALQLAAKKPLRSGLTSMTRKSNFL